MAAKVSAEKLENVLRAKLAAARVALHNLREAELPEMNRHWDPAQYIVNFLHAARGVCPVVETFIGQNPYRAWVAIWERSKLTPAERELWRRIREARVDQEHGEGAALIPFSIEVTRGNQIQAYRNAVLLGVDPTGNKCSKGGVRFSVYPDEPASHVCERYYALALRFVDDFLSDHASPLA